MKFAEAINYIVGSIGKIPQLITGISYYTTGGIKRSINLLQDNMNTHINMGIAENKFYDFISINFWISLIFSVITVLVSSLSNGIAGILGGLIASIMVIIGLIVGFAVCAIIIGFGMQFSSRWSLTIMKVATILYMLSIVGSILGTWQGVLSLLDTIRWLRYSSFSTLVISVLDLLLSIIQLFILGGILDSITEGTRFNANQNGFNQNGFGQNQNGFSQNQNGSGQNQNGFGQPGVGFGQPNQGFGQQGQTNQGFGQQINLNKQSQQSQQTVTSDQQLYGCPYCGKGIHYGVATCPHCGNSIMW